MVQHRGKDYVLRICDRVAFRRPGAGNKVCSLGKVTQVDEARAQIGVHRCVPDATGLRAKWRLGFTDEEGRLTPGEGARPCVESVTVKEIISKVDINKDGVLAAASARKLDKGGYVLQERARATRDSAVGFLMLNLRAGTSWFRKACLTTMFGHSEGHQSPRMACHPSGFWFC